MIKKHQKSKLIIRYTKPKDGLALSRWFLDDEALQWFAINKTQTNIKAAVKYWMSHNLLNSSLTAELDGQTCGIATLFLLPYAKVAHQSEIGIIINKQQRGLGIGTILLYNLEKLAKTRFGLEFLHLQVFNENPAISLYKRLGFTIFGKHSHWIKEKENKYRSCFFMTTELPFRKNICKKNLDNYIIKETWKKIKSTSQKSEDGL